jgi:ParB-like chromosome segregation protein Spo0J
VEGNTLRIDIPCMDIKLIDVKLLQANNYNPNNVPKDKMGLLKQSIIDNGFCFPIVTIYDDEIEKYIIIDGFHRYTIAQQLKMKEVPIVVLKHEINKRMAATVQFNKARGVHAVDMDAEIIRSLIEQGMSEPDICTHLGIDIETVQRYKSLTGIVELFKNVSYSKSWGVDDFDN